MEERESLSTPLVSRRISQPVDRSRRMCPVCKTDCSVATVVPIYVREEKETNDCNETDSDGNGDVSDLDDIVEVNDEGEGGISSTYQTAAGTGLRRRRRLEHNPDSSNDAANTNTNTDTRTSPGQNAADDRNVSNNALPNRPPPPPPPASSATIPSESTRNVHIRRNRGTDAIFDVLLGMQSARDPIPSIHNPGGAGRSRPIEEDSTMSLIGNLLLIFGSIVLLFLLLS